jgi:hypothetical protein
MLQMTIAPSQTIIPVQAGPSLQDVMARVQARILAGDLTMSTGESYIGALNAVAERQNKPLSLIPAALEEIARILPLNGFSPARETSNKAYDLKRRRVTAAVKEFLGIHAAMKALRAQQDDWSDLFAILEPLTKAKSGQWRWHPMKLEALRTFALVARAQGWQPRDLNGDRAKKIDDLYGGNKRTANQKCLERLDELRVFPEALALLPPEPIGFDAAHRQELKSGFPAAFEAAFNPWIDAVTKSGWDPVVGEFSDEHDDHARVLRSAFRCFLRIALAFDLISPDETDILPVLSCDDAVRIVAREMFARKTRTKAEGKLAPRTTRKYLKGICQVLSSLGANVTVLSQIITNNKDSRKGAKAEKRMTKKNQDFCEMLIDNLHLRRRFLFSFSPLRAEAEAIMDMARIEGREMTRNEMSRVRMLGACACFAALEIGGAPIRVENAMGLTCVGADAQIRIPLKGNKPMEVLIPEELTKNGVEIRFPIRRNKHGCYDTIRWYYQTIRPLFDHAATSPYLIPAVTTPGKPMNPGYIGEKFSELMRTIVNLPMTPHQMRHGQTSLLLDKHPEEITVIAKRIDDTVDTLRMFYGWLNSMKLVERGQDLLVGLMDD